MSIKKLTIDQLKTLKEMIENDAMTKIELAELSESIKTIFSALLEENQDNLINDLYEDLEVLDEMFSELNESINNELDLRELVVDRIDETQFLHKTPMSVRLKARKYAKSAKGKKARLKILKLRKRFKNKIKFCNKRGMNFSFKFFKCLKKKKRK
jgi:hypothetical protein